MSLRDHLLPPAMQDSWQDQTRVMEQHGKTFGRFQQQLPPPPQSLASSDGARFSSLAWNNVPSLVVPLSSTEAGAAPSMSLSSSSSAVVLPGDGGSCQMTNCSSESSGHSGSVLKEHDYIGMAEISSAAVSAAGEEVGRSGCLHLEETDLRLGLGPLIESEAPPKTVPRTQDMHSSLELNKDGRVEAKGVDVRSESPWRGRPQAIRSSQETPKSEWSIADSQHERQVSSDLQQRIGGQGPRHAFMDGTPEHGALQYVWQGSVGRSTEGTRVSTREFAAPQISIPGQDFEGLLPAVLNAHAGTRVGVPPSKNGVKRAYSEAMADPARFNVGESRPGSNGASVAAAVVKNALQLQESEVKALQKHHHAAFLPNWATSKSIVPAPWHVGHEPIPSYKPVGMTVPRPDNQDSAADDSPPQKGQVVGWPPIRSYRKNTLAAHPKPADGEGDGQASAGGQSVSPNFVKVNMDGITIGRKVDLNAHSCYEGLLLALEEMFQPSIGAQGSSQSASGRESLATGAKYLRLLNGSEFVLTHEDNEGDWMLVGDVPWGMFVNTVRRLRIMRGSEATGLIPRGQEKGKGLV